MTRTLPAIALAAMLATPAAGATVAFDRAGPFLAVASDAYAGGKLGSVTRHLTRGAEIDMELLTLLAFIALVLALWGDDPRHDCACGVVPDPAAPVPLPSALGGMLAGLGALGFVGWRRRIRAGLKGGAE